MNLLRFHEAETAILFCATRDNVRHLHASLVERGFAAVALSGEHSQNERNQALQALRDGRARVCVATDVAARGIDLPGLSLVVHVELPRDAETLQHRSGRTGRAGRKGTAILVVPYPRRRRVDMMLRSARIAVEWRPVPSAEDIRSADRERLLVKLAEPVELDDEDRALGARLLETKSADEVAAMLVRALRASMPAPEEMAESAAEPQRRESAHRPGFDDTVWFRMDIGRRQNADPRWLLPLICRRGHVTRDEIGAIRIGPMETFVQIPRNAAGKFAAAVQRTAAADNDESGITITPSDGPPAQGAGGRARPSNAGGRPPAGKPRYQARPTRPGGPRR